MAGIAPRGVEVPVIETERLRLRGHRPADFADCAAMWADPVVTRYIGGEPLSEEDVWARTLRYLGHWAWLGFGYWVMEEKATGSFVGEMEFSDWRREIKPSLKGVPELGWVLATRAHGKGFATEEARAAIAWGDLNLMTAQPALGRLARDPGRCAGRASDRCPLCRRLGDGSARRPSRSAPSHGGRC